MKRKWEQQIMDQETYQDLEPLYEKLQRNRTTRVQKLYNDFAGLSQAEKEEFVNLISEFVIHGTIKKL